MSNDKEQEPVQFEVEAPAKSTDFGTKEVGKMPIKYVPSSKGEEGQEGLGDYYVFLPEGMEHGTIRASGSAYVSAATAIFDREKPERAEAMMALEARFQALPDALLHTIVEGTESASQYVGNPDFSDETLQSLARFEKGERENARLREEVRAGRRWSLTEKIVVGIVLVVAGIVGFLIRGQFQ